MLNNRVSGVENTGGEDGMADNGAGLACLSHSVHAGTLYTLSEQAGGEPAAVRAGRVH